jgi:hypothetical protein
MCLKQANKYYLLLILLLKNVTGYLQREHDSHAHLDPLSDVVLHHSSQVPRNKIPANSKATGQKYQYKKKQMSLSRISNSIQLINNNSYPELHHEVLQPIPTQIEQEPKSPFGEKQQ